MNFYKENYFFQKTFERLRKKFSFIANAAFQNQFQLFWYVQNHILIKILIT